uniref:glycosyltransferase family 39 protein n=1 Tax=Acetatifactor sp. TaxID=1872090 RepID=UPI004055E99D
MNQLCEGKKENIWKYACIGIFILENLLYLYLAIQRTFHYDEAYSVGMIFNSFDEIIEITGRDVHSPFYYFALKLFCMIPGINDLVGAKLFSWLFMMLFLLFGGHVVSKRYGEKVTFFWILLSGFIPSMVIQSTTVRMYTMGLFFVTVASYLAYSLYEQETRKKWILYTIFSIMTVYIHTFCMLAMVAVYIAFMIAVLYKKNYRKLRNILLSGVIVSISFLPWLYSLWQQFSRWAGWETGWKNSFEEVTLNSFVIYLSEWFSSMENPQTLAVIFGVFLFIYVSYYVRTYVKETQDYFPYMGMILVGIVVTAGVLVSVYIVPCFLGRYVLPLFGGVWLFAAIGIAKSGKLATQIILSAVILLIGFIAYGDELKLEEDEGLNTYIECVEKEMNLSEDVIMADRYFTALFSIYYPEAEYMVYGYAPEGLPFPNTEVFTDWSQLETVDTVWLISFANNPGADLGDGFVSEKSFMFDYSYYNIRVDKLVRKSVDEKNSV